MDAKPDKQDKLVTKSDKIIFILIGVLLVLAIIFWSDLRTIVAGKSTKTEKTEKKEKKDEKKKDKGDNDNKKATDTVPE